MKRWVTRAAVIMAVTLLLVVGLGSVVGASTWTDLPTSVLDGYDITAEQVAEISSGYPDGTWKPFAGITRAQFVKMAVTAFSVELATPAAPSFSDVPPGDYYYSYIEGAAAAGLVTGVGGGLFTPGATITREQAIAIIARAVAAREGFDLSSLTEAQIAEALGDFGDQASVSPSLRDEMAYAVLQGITYGDTAGNLAPKATTSRIAAAALLIRASYTGPADVVLTNGVIYTVDEGRTTAEAIAIKDDTIIFVGSAEDAGEYIGEDTSVIDLEGKLVLPGLIDSHAHATSGVSDIYEVFLYGIGSIEEYQQAIADFIEATPDLTGLQGAGWINSVFGEHGPTAAILDEVCPDIPAVLYSEDYHSVWVNTKTLELAGITADTPDVEGGVIERDSEGNPTGTLRENATSLVADVIPPYTVDQLVEGLTYFQDFAHSLGLTTVYIPSMPSGDAAVLEALHEFEASGEMSIRFPTAMNVEPTDDLSIVDDIIAARTAEAGGLFEIVAAKIFMDGVLEGVTAYLEEPYDVRPGYRGELLWDPDTYNEMCAALDAANIQIHVHSIGDAATRITLDGFAYARAQNGVRDNRPMVTHLQLVNDEDIPRFGQLGVIAVPQPYWFVIDTYYDQAVEYVGQERADKQYPMKSFFDAGVTVASASDYPVSWPPDPLLAIEIGVTRTVPEGSEIYVGADFDTPLNPAECVTVEQMIESFTINGAKAIFRENEIGSLEVGKKADLVVLSQNILTIDSREIHNTVPLLTYFAGQEVYRSEDFD
jgi:predicted amidohydrolase YtcJ